MTHADSLTLYHDTYACTGPAGAAAPELVLLHGWGLHSVVWDPVVPDFLEHFQVTVIDLPGMGRSPLPRQGLQRDDLVRRLLAVAPARAVWMGWSLGGELALAVAAQAPQRVSALALVATNACFLQREDWPCAMPAAVFRQFSELFAEDGDGTLFRFLALQCRGSERMKEDIRFLQEIVYLQGLPAPRALREGLDLLATLDLRHELATLQQPVQLILGATDYLVPAAAGDALKALQPALSLAVIEGSGHAPFLAQPALFLAAFHDFCRERLALAC